MALRGLIADSMRRRALEAETRIRAMVTKNLQAEIRNRKRQQLPATSTSQVQTTPTEAATVDSIKALLASMPDLPPDPDLLDPLKVTRGQWEALQKLPEAPQVLSPAGMPISTTAQELMINAMIHGIAVMIVEPEPPMTATEVLQLQALWELEKGIKLQKKMVPSTSAT